MTKLDRLKREEPKTYSLLLSMREAAGETRLSIKFEKYEVKEKKTGLDFKYSKPFIKG